MRKALLLCAIAAVACLAVAVGGALSANTAGFADAAGDSGNAPDVTAVNVSNDDAGTISFAITVANRPTLGPQDFLTVVMDTDGNASNGVHGFDYVAGVGSTGAALLSGASGSLASATAPSLHSSYSGGVAIISVNRADIGSPSSIIFFVQGSGDGGSTVGEDAPDGSGIWNYQVIISAAPAPAPATAPAPAPAQAPATQPLTLSAVKVTTSKARAGQPFVVLMLVKRGDSGGLLAEGTVSCNARLNGSPLKPTRKAGPKAGLATCAWQLPKNAHAKQLTGSVTVTDQGAKISRPFSLRVA